MSYSAAINELNAMAPELYTRPGQARRKFSLDEVRILLAALGDPHHSIRSVLIAGTNGKGSTAATLASILTASGVRSGLYTSPHLERVNERIRIDLAQIADDAFARLYFRVHDVAQKLVCEGRLPQHPSFFEILTALALVYFAEEKVELAVLEVGMGGRLDATNAADPLLSIITDISLDHTEWLGSTITAITREKAGILRKNGTLITLPQHPEANQVLGEAVAELSLRQVKVEAYLPPRAAENATSYPIEVMGATINVASPLIGTHQHRNVALAIAAAVELASAHGFPITPESIAQGIHQTMWPGRIERFESGGVRWILDVAHNPAGAWALRSGLSELLSEIHPRLLVFSCLRDKPVAEMAGLLFPLFDQVIFAPIHSARATPLEAMEASARATGTSTLSADSVREALQWAGDRAQGGAVVVSGSVYLVGEARALLFGRGLEI
ncbi:MAG: folylpolyglutamate synthase/dihydrofolate synthase family protein [Terracidiphilus sp.]